MGWKDGGMTGSQLQAELNRSGHPGGPAASRVSDQPAGRASHAAAASVEDVGANHGRRDVVVAEQFLDGSYVVIRIEQMRGEGVPPDCRRAGSAQSRRAPRPHSLHTADLEAMNATGPSREQAGSRLEPDSRSGTGFRPEWRAAQSPQRLQRLPPSRLARRLKRAATVPSPSATRSVRAPCARSAAISPQKAIPLELIPFCNLTQFCVPSPRVLNVPA